MKRMLNFSCSRSFLIAIIITIFISTSLLNSQPCEIPDNGTGTITLPPIGCDYYPPDEVYMIIEGLPPGTTIELDGPLTDFICCPSCPLCSMPLPPGECEMPGGSLGGHGDCFESTLDLTVIGTGELTGFTRSIAIPVFCEVHTGPRTPGDPVQTFPIRMYRMQGELFGDPDFCTFSITAGLDYGLPCPGQTTLTELPSGDFAVDSFFDITYQIEFEGCVGSQLEGYMGTTTATIRIETERLPAVNDFIEPGLDFWIVPESPVSSIHIGGPGGEIILPADFFGPGSDPFEGVIALQGESHVSTEFPNADCIIERTSQANLPESYPASDLISTEIIELDLVGIEPITVTYFDGQDPEPWDVVMEAAPTPQNPGIISITKNDANGGEFQYSPMDVYPRLIFTKVDPPNDILIIDYNNLEYSNPIVYPWEHSPIGNDFNPSGTYSMELISAGGDCELYLNPYLLRQDDFWVFVGSDGTAEGGGSGYNDGEWYYYPNTDWWNIWFFDHPYDQDRVKGMNISFTIDGPGGAAEVVINYSTDIWSDEGTPGIPPLPPLSVDDEEDYIIRPEPIFSGQILGPTPINVYFEIPDYNPEWISIDIRGWNFNIINGTIEHVCFASDEEPEELDFGDAPDPLYPTLLANDGARHILDGVTYLGALIDAEPDGLPDPNALGDNIDNLPDEDGIAYSQFMTGSPGQFVVTTSAPGYLQGWVDFNADNDWTDPGEQIFMDVYIHFAGTVCLNYYVPANATIGNTFARFRFSTVGGLGITGQAPDGEVEDHEIDIVDDPEIKWSQYWCEYLPGLHCHDYDIPPYNQIILADDWLCNGGLVTDIHWWGNYELDAINQEIRGAGIDHFHLSIHDDDPTGTCLPLYPESWNVDLLFNDITEFDTGIVNSEGSPIYLYEYILDDPFPQIEGNQYWLDITAICADPVNPAHWRWQESTRMITPILCGAVEKVLPNPGIWQRISWANQTFSDMAFEITSVEYVDELDFGDAPETGTSFPTKLANDGARHVLDEVTYLGALYDAEADGQPDATATGDDLDGNDDEDGVLFVSPLIVGEQGAIYVYANVPGFLNAWLDFDGSSSWDASEQIFTDEPLIMGWNPLNFPVPSGAAIGNSFARFRFDTGGGLGITGQADDGEVEDYRVLIEEDLHDGLKMHYHQWPDTTSFGVDVCTMEWRMLADDFFCVESGPINSIHIWGSWKYDEMMQDNAIFEFGIWSDNPGLPPDIWSEPATLLWERLFFPGEYLELPYYFVPDGEWWYDFYQPLIFPGDFTVWEYDFTIPDAEAFFQEEDTVYWLSVRTWTVGPYFEFGWKSSVNHWNDDAVWLNEPTRQFWQELIYPFPHPFNLSGEEHVSMDMAFYIDCHPSNPVNFTITKVGTNMTLQWDPSWCASYYNVYSSTDPYAIFPGGWTLEPTGIHITTTTWNDPLPAGGKKFYRVTAEN